MHWIIQSNFFREVGVVNLLDFLEKFQIPHDVVDVVPEEEQLIPNPNVTGPVMVCGSTMLNKIAKARQWTPGSFLNDNHDYRKWKEHYGDHLLNAEAVVSRFADVEQRFDPFFIRPCLDSKTFTGKVVYWNEYLEWRNKVLSLGKAYSTLDANTMVSYAPVKTIYTETRFFVVDGKIVSNSMYVCGSLKYPQCKNFVTDQMAIDFVNNMIESWQPARAFVIDVASTDEGYKVIEINCINSSGFYGIDIAKFVEAIESMQFPED